MEKKLRVKSKQDFQKVISSKKSLANDSFVIYYLKNEYPDPRFGISASKKIGGAVTRVKVRRQIRAMIWDLLKQGIIEKLDYVVIVRKGFLKKNYHQNEEELSKLFKKIGGITNAKKD